MARFEVYIAADVEAEGFRLVEKDKLCVPRIELQHGQSWREALGDFISRTLGEVSSFSELEKLETAVDDSIPLLVVHTKSYLARKAVVQEGRYEWVAADSLLKRKSRPERIDPSHEVELYTDGGSRDSPDVALRWRYYAYRAGYPGQRSGRLSRV